MLKLNCLQFVCLVARPLTRGGFWTMKLMIKTKTESCIIGPLLFLMAAFLFLFLFLFFFWGVGGEGSGNYSVPFSPLHFLFT